MRSAVLIARAVLPAVLPVILPVILVAAALAVGALGLHIFLTERGAANEIKGFVLMLLAAVLFVGGCVLWQLHAIRRALEEKNR